HDLSRLERAVAEARRAPRLARAAGSVSVLSRAASGRGIDAVTPRRAISPGGTGRPGASSRAGTARATLFALRPRRSDLLTPRSAGPPSILILLLIFLLILLLIFLLILRLLSLESTGARS